MKPLEIPKNIEERVKRMFSNESERRDAMNAVFIALTELQENPIVPTEEEAREAASRFWTEWVQGNISSWENYRDWAVEWQRRMFQPREPEVPEEIKLLAEDYPRFKLDPEKFTEALMKARELGRLAVMKEAK